jgi:triacylglycerol lipase
MTPHPIVLVHGITDDSQSFAPHLHWLRAGGRVVRAPDLFPADGSLGLAHMAEQLAAYVELVCGELEVETIDLVGFSLGGIVARYYMQRLDGARRVRRFVTIASPHGGSLSAYGLRSRAGEELRPGSALLNDLASDWLATAARVPTTVLWTPFDLIVLPGWHAILEGATAIPVPARRHADMLHHPRTWQNVREVLDAIEEVEPTAVTP